MGLHAVLLLAVALAWPGATRADQPPEAASQTKGPESVAGLEGTVGAVVTITDLLRFEPKLVEIQLGEVVEWNNISVLVHTVTGDPSLVQLDGSASLPPGATSFDSGNMEPDATFRHRFDVPGTYKYFCIPHEAAKMSGTVIVKAK